MLTLPVLFCCCCEARIMANTSCESWICSLLSSTSNEASGFDNAAAAHDVAPAAAAAAAAAASAGSAAVVLPGRLIVVTVEPGRLEADDALIPSSF